ncbi:MAG: RNA polymerase sigma factor [Chloroflexi bacterium]|nr:MAG: RNA polymerase sigma factor [Chloroflexota bacterium]
MLERRWRLLAPYRDEIVGLVRRRGLPLTDAEDCAHEALARVVGFRALDESRAVQLLRTVAWRLVVDAHRQRGRDVRARARLHEAEPAPPEEAVLDRAEARWLVGRVAELPAREREVITVRLQGKPPAEAARALGITPDAADSAFRRARLHLRLLAAAAGAVTVAMVRRVVRTAPTPSLVAISAAGIVLMAPAIHSPHLGAQPEHVTGDQQVVSGLASAERPLGATAPPRTPVVGGSGWPLAGGGGRVPRRPGTTQLATVAVGQPNSVHWSPVTVTKHDQQETLLESLQRCVGQGVELTLREIGCRP